MAVVHKPTGKIRIVAASQVFKLQQSLKDFQLQLPTAQELVSWLVVNNPDLFRTKPLFNWPGQRRTKALTGRKLWK